MTKKLLFVFLLALGLTFTGVCWADEAADKAVANLQKQIDKATTSGNSDEQRLVGNEYLNGHVSIQDTNKAIEWYEKSAAQNNVKTMVALGNLYLTNPKVKQDYVKAREWFEKGAAFDDKWCLNRLGEIYEKGKGVEVDMAKALEYFKRACELKDSTGCNAVERVTAATAK